MNKPLTVFVPCAGRGQRLGHLTDFLPKPLIKIGDRAILSYIFESYHSDTRFVVQLGYLGHLIKEYCELAHPDLNIEFHELDKWEGPGSSLCYGISQAQHLLQEPFIFHACDGLINYVVPPIVDSNWLGWCDTTNTSQYRTLEMSGYRVDSILEKGELESTRAFVGVFAIYDWQKFWSCCWPELDTSDADILMEMLSEGSELYGLELDWHDTGNLEVFDRTRKYIQSVEKSDSYLIKAHESAYVFDDFVVKFNSDSNIVDRIVDRSNTLKGFVPAITDKRTNHFKYTKVQGDLYLNTATPENFKSWLDFCESMWDLKNTPDINLDKFQRSVGKFYENKTKSRVQRYLTQTETTESDVVINHNLTPTTSRLLELLSWHKIGEQAIPVSRYHGDLHLSNTIQTDTGFQLIDWRDSFVDGYGDLYYELAKIYHSLLISHDLIEQGKFSVDVNEDGVRLYHHSHNHIIDCKTMFVRWVGDHGWSFKHVQLLTSLIFLSSCPLHHEPYNTFLYYLGRNNLFGTVSESNYLSTSTLLSDTVK